MPARTSPPAPTPCWSPRPQAGAPPGVVPRAGGAAHRGHAGADIASGSYAVLVAPPAGWRRAGCVPECEWTDAQGLSELRQRLARKPYPLAATFEAEQSGAVRVAFRSPPGTPALP